METSRNLDESSPESRIEKKYNRKGVKSEREGKKRVEDFHPLPLITENF